MVSGKRNLNLGIGPVCRRARDLDQSDVDRDGERAAEESQIEIGDTVEFMMDIGQWRKGEVVIVKQEPGWTSPQYQIKYRNGFFWRSRGEVNRMS